jgi:protein ImuA
MSPSAVSSNIAAPGAKVAELRRRIDALERAGVGDQNLGDAQSGGAQRALPFGVPEIDAALPWDGLALGALHEISGPARDGAALGFVSALLARLVARAPGAVLWCRRLGAAYEAGNIYAPGLAGLGLDPSRLIVLGARHGRDVLWAMREGLSCPRLVAVVGEVEAAAVGLTASRRLQLAAEKSGVSCFLLRTTSVESEQSDTASENSAENTAENTEAPSAALSRWHVRAAPSGPVPGLAPAEAEQRWLGPGQVRWRTELRRCRGAAPAEWRVEWHHETGNFTLAAPLSDRSVEPAAAQLAI